MYLYVIVYEYTYVYFLDAILFYHGQQTKNKYYKDIPKKMKKKKKKTNYQHDMILLRHLFCKIFRFFIVLYTKETNKQKHIKYKYYIYEKYQISVQ